MGTSYIAPVKIKIIKRSADTPVDDCWDADTIKFAKLLLYTITESPESMTGILGKEAGEKPVQKAGTVLQLTRMGRGTKVAA